MSKNNGKKKRANEVKKLSFQARYGMTKAEWTAKKKELKKAGQGEEIAKTRHIAYQRFKKK